jgi:putative hydrolase of the HAD superfamily
VQSIWPELTDSAADRVSADYLAAYEAGWTPFDDVMPCLDALSSHRFGVITNGQTEQQIDKLVRTGLKSRFEVIVVSSEVGFAKPDPRIFAEACRRAGESSELCWHVGDRLDKDPLPAIAAGLSGIWLNRDLKKRGDPRVPTIRRLDELPGLVARFGKS